MNERLKELALQAGFETNGAIYTVGNYQNGHEYFWAEDFIENELEKFAELIVRECVDKVDKTGFNFNEQPQYNDKQNALVSEGFFWALESVKQQIREHFGVEE